MSPSPQAANHCFSKFCGLTNPWDFSVAFSSRTCSEALGCTFTTPVSGASCAFFVFLKREVRGHLSKSMFV